MLTETRWFTLSFYAVLLSALTVSTSRAQTTTVLYDAGAGPATDPTLLPQWSAVTFDGGIPNLNGTASTTSDGIAAWKFGDALVGGGQQDSLAYDFTPQQRFEMSSFGFSLEVKLESLGTGGFISLGYDGNFFKQTGPDRSGFTPGNSGGTTQTFVWSFDPKVDSTIINSRGVAIANTTFSWSGSYARLNLADNSTNSAMNLSLVSAVLTIEDDPGAFIFNLNRDTGEVTLTNTSDINLNNIVGYSILSTAGSLDQSGWDKQEVGASQLANDTDQWTALTKSGISTDLSESVIEPIGDGSGGDLAAFSGSWSFGNVWRRSRFDDLAIEVLVDDGSSEEGRLLTSLAGDFRVTYTGGEVDPADLDGNGVVNSLDWVKFKTGYGSDVSDLTDFEAYMNGSDINLDGVSNIADFLAYRNLFAAATGENLVFGNVTVPEPATWMMVVFGLAGVFGVKRVSRPNRQIHLFGMVLVTVLAMSSTSHALTLTLYDADPDNDAMTPAPDPLSLGWFINNASGLVPSAGFSTPGTTTGGAQAWILSDAGPTGTNPNQNNRLGYTLDAITLDQMDLGGFTLTMEFEQRSNGSFVGMGYNHDGSDNDIGLVADSRYGQTPTAGLRTFIYSWDGTTFTPNPGAAGPANFSEFWGGSIPGGGMIFFGDNSAGTAGMNLAITKVTLAGPQVNPVELGATVNLVSGEIKLFGDDITNLNVTSYVLTSSLGQLLPGNLSSLESQHIGDPTMDPDNGIGFETLSATSHDITEADLTGSTVFGNSTNLSLGNIFDTTTSELDRDLVLSFTTLAGTFSGQVNYISGLTVDGDYNGNGIVDAADYTVWRDNLGSNVAMQNENPSATTPGVVDQEDYDYWKSRFGATSGSGSVAGTPSVPEPSSALLTFLGTAGAVTVLRQRIRSRFRISRFIYAALVLAIAWAVGGGSALAMVTNDRNYSLGDDNDENANAGNTVGMAAGGVTYDSAGTLGTGNLQDLSVRGVPKYVDVSNRPGAAVGDLGALSDGEFDSLGTSISMNAPAQMWDNTTFFPGPPTGSIFPQNYEGIFAHGIQLWAKPNQTALGTAAQTIIRDTPEHGIGITAGGNWELQFDKGRFDTGVSVASTLDENGWAHIMEISGFADRFNGSTASGGALLVNGVVIRAQSTPYDPAATELVVGAESNGAGGYQNHFKGTLDDVRMFLWGNNSNQLGQDNAVGGTNSPSGLNADGQNWGTLDLGIDNDWIALHLAGLGVTDRGDVDLSGGAANSGDVDAFLNHWRKQFTVNGSQVGDWNSRQQGDLNYDGIVDLRDARILNNSLLAAGAGGLDFSLLGSNVPEPSTCILVTLGLLVVGATHRNRSHQIHKSGSHSEMG